MPYTTIIYTRQAYVANITLNRPDVGNTINQPMAQELADICRTINEDDSIHAVVVTGAGEKAFCSGSELEQLLQSGRYRPSPLPDPVSWHCR